MPVLGDLDFSLWVLHSENFSPLPFPLPEFLPAGTERTEEPEATPVARAGAPVAGAAADQEGALAGGGGL